MAIYRIPLRFHGARRAHKAIIEINPSLVQGAIELNACTPQEAMEKLRSLVIPADPRPVWGRRHLGKFIIS